MSVTLNASNTLETADHAGQAIEIVPLQVIGVRAFIERVLNVLIFIAIDQDDHRNIVELSLAPDPPQNRQAAPVGKRQIDDDEFGKRIMTPVAINADALQIKDCLVAVARDPQRIDDLRTAKALIQQEQIVRAVLKEKYDAISLHSVAPFRIRAS